MILHQFRERAYAWPANREIGAPAAFCFVYMGMESLLPDSLMFCHEVRWRAPELSLSFAERRVTVNPVNCGRREFRFPPRALRISGAPVMKKTRIAGVIAIAAMGL